MIEGKQGLRLRGHLSMGYCEGETRITVEGTSEYGLL